MIAKLEREIRTAQQNIDLTQKNTNMACINIVRTSALEQKAILAMMVVGEGGLQASYWRHIFVQDSAVVETQYCLAHLGAS